ncbi:MAG: DUF4013 domain-containing protein [Halanaeroarchaeum sp.]
MLEDGLGYPVRGEWLGRIVIGGALSLLSVLFFPIFLVTGYFVQVLESTIEGDDEPPEFTDWGRLFVRGVGATIIALAYSIVPLFLYGFVVLGFFGAGAAVGGDAGGFLAGAGVLATLLFVPVLLFVYYLIPAALANYAVGGSIGAGFEFATIRSVVFSAEYLVAVLLPIVVAVLIWVASAVLAFTIVGLVLLPFVQFYGQMAVFRMFGTAFASVTGRAT